LTKELSKVTPWAPIAALVLVRKRCISTFWSSSMTTTMFGRACWARFRFLASLAPGARATATESSPAKNIAPVTRVLPGPRSDLTVSSLPHVLLNRDAGGELRCSASADSFALPG
jgi:hypothetical protein